MAGVVRDEYGPEGQRTLELRVFDGQGGVAPTVANVAAGRYPLAKPLVLVTRGQPRGQLQRFIEFATSERGKAILARYFVPVNGVNKP